MSEERFAEHELVAGGCAYTYYAVHDIPGADRLPVSLQVLVENVLRCVADPAEARAQA